ncbi:DegT/DnrJ/EryC1/StrS family aminotransferase [Natrialbaceae archaeon GCM10025810]|uniref:DegT/DnrJ/EryC1/StrS family aminotransferase n=1 Tax=Halovalidus salilacus TaxID=3075124 RepID=UPI003612CBC9
MPDEVSFTDIYVDDEIVKSVESVLRGTRYVKGPQLEQFEAEFASECGVEHAIGVSSGTAAIQLALNGLGIGPDDDVFVPSHTFYATASPVLSMGANPVFVDVDPETYTLDPDDLAEKVADADQPTAIVPVHIYGQLAEMDAILDVAAEHDLHVVEDACQAHFATRDGEYAGSIGDAGAFSFYPSKNMTVAGDGGMVVTDDDALAAEIRALRNHGRNESGNHVRLGLNYRMDEVSAAVGRKQLTHIHDWNDGRRDAARQYDDRLAAIPEIETPTVAPANEHVYHLYVIQAENRSQLKHHLESQGIQTGIHYETPVHQEEPIVERVGQTALPITEGLSPRILSLPMHPRLSGDEIDAVCDAIEGFYA